MPTYLPPLLICLGSFVLGLFSFRLFLFRLVISRAEQDVLAERVRQITVEGYLDDAHRSGELEHAAACYALQAAGRGSWGEAEYQATPPVDDGSDESLWPWPLRYWKPKNPRRDLVRAAALLVAAIEKIDRAEGKRLQPLPGVYPLA